MMEFFRGFYTFDFATSGNFEGICAAVLVDPDGNIAEVWPKKKERGSYAKLLSSVDLVKLTHALIEASEKAPLVGWGTLGYDFRLLYKEGIAKHEVVNLALNHYDLMFQIFSETGAMVSLGSIMHSTSLDPHLSKIVPELWNSGDREKQDQVIMHTLRSANRVFNVMRQLTHHNTEVREITWLDYSAHNNQLSYKTKPTPCSNFIIPAMMLPSKALNEKWSKTFSWIKEHAEAKAKGENLSSDRLDAMAMIKELA